MRRSTYSRRCLAAVVASVLAGLLGAATARSGVESYSEDAVKAAFLLRFAEYVDWPPAALASGRFTVAVIGADGVVANLQHLLPGYSIKNLPTQVRPIRSIQELGDSQMLYLGRGQNDALRAALVRALAQPILLVTDEEQNLDAGGAVNFVLIDQRVRFEVSLPAAERSGVTISSELLSVAYRVLTDGRRARPDPSP